MQWFRRFAWLAVAAAMTGFGVFEIVVHDLGPLPIVVFALPELSLIAGAGQSHERGQLPPRAVRAAALAHRLSFPLVLITLAVGALIIARVLNQTPEQFEAARRIPLYSLTVGIAWVARIAFDRAFGLDLH